MTEALKIFLEWCNERKPELEKDKFNIEVVINPKTSNSSAFIEFSNENIFGRIYGWESGDIEYECFYMRRDEAIFSKKTTFMENVTPIEKANSYLNEFIAVQNQ